MSIVTDRCRRGVCRERQAAPEFCAPRNWKEEGRSLLLTDALHVEQFAIVDNEPVDRGPNAGVFTGRGAGDDRAELFVVAEGTTPAGEAFAGHVVSALGQLWATLDQSLTGSIRRLFEEADRNLRDWNAKSIAQHHVALGLSCLARRGAQVVIGQAGPTVAFHFSGGAVRAIFPDGEHRAPLGADGDEPQLERLDLAPGDRVLLLSTPAERTLGQDLVEGILSLPREQVLRDLYHRVRELRHVTALLVSART